MAVTHRPGGSSANCLGANCNYSTAQSTAAGAASVSPWPGAGEKRSRYIFAVAVYFCSRGVFLQSWCIFAVASAQLAANRRLDDESIPCFRDWHSLEHPFPPPSTASPSPGRALAPGTPWPGDKSCQALTCYIPGRAARRRVPALPEVLMRPKIKRWARRHLSTALATEPGHW